MHVYMILYIYVYAYVYVCTYLDVCICTQHNTYCTCQRRAVFPTLLWQHTAMNKFTNQLGRHHVPTQVPRRLVAYPCLVYYNTTMKANKVSIHVCLYHHVNSTNHSLSYSGKTFKGENSCESRSFVTICESFLREIWGRDILWYGKSEQSAKIFFVKIEYFLPIRKSLLPQKFPAIWYFCPRLIVW